MQFSNHSGRAQRGGIVYLAVDAIAPSAVQPRQNFPPAQLEELSRSIAEYGVLSPLTVRTRPGGYELVAGERRLRAARMAGLSEVPCIVMELDLEEASFIALVENLQRNDLDFLEESRGIAQLIRLFGLSQEECARRLGKSQSAVANKLRLLRLPEDVLNAMRNAGLTERHGRALLRLETPDEQRAALTEKLRALTGKSIVLETRTDASLLGGVIVGAIQGAGNRLFGIPVYAQQVNSLIALVVVLALIVYMHTVIRRMPRRAENASR